MGGVSMCWYEVSPKDSVIVALHKKEVDAIN